MNSNWTWWLGAVVMTLVMVASPAVAQDAGVAQTKAAIDSVATLSTTYVFRGEPQYSDEEIPSLQLGVGGSYFWDTRSFAWLDLWAGTALNERDANAALGTRDEIDVGLGYGYWLRNDMELKIGGVIYLLPESDPKDVAKEVMVGYTWRVTDDAEWLFAPYGRLYGEVHRQLGVYGEIGFDVVRQLGNGFELGYNLHGGTSRYAEENVDQFNHFTTAVALAYNVFPEWTIAGQFNVSVTNDATQISSDFLEKHGIFWSSLKLRYSPTF